MTDGPYPAGSLYLPQQDTAYAAFLLLAARRGLRWFRVDRWLTETTALEDDLGEIVGAWRQSSASEQRLIDREGGALFITLAHGGVRVHAAGEGPDHVSALMRAVRAAVPRLEPSGDVVPVDFWVDSTPPSSTSRRLAMPEWAEIAGNYPEATRGAVESLAGLDGPPAGGRLVLWHGPPGTGKTTALRALLRAWRPWARPSYLTDPDDFLADPTYMQQVLLAEIPGDRWNLVVLEDTADLLRKNGPYRDGVARLLNLTDGLLGQGLKVLVLATSNDAPEDLDPALLRPGRCAAEVAFPPFSPDEAAEWLDEPEPLRSAMTLADLFARIEGREPAVRERRPVGFMAP